MQSNPRFPRSVTQFLSETGSQSALVPCLVRVAIDLGLHANMLWKKELEKHLTRLFQVMEIP